MWRLLRTIFSMLFFHTVQPSILSLNEKNIHSFNRIFSIIGLNWHLSCKNSITLIFCHFQTVWTLKLALALIWSKPWVHALRLLHECKSSWIYIFLRSSNSCQQLPILICLKIIKDEISWKIFTFHFWQHFIDYYAHMQSHVNWQCKIETFLTKIIFGKNSEFFPFLAHISTFQFLL